jgi:hypothetical protein
MFVCKELSSCKAAHPPQDLKSVGLSFHVRPLTVASFCIVQLYEYSGVSPRGLCTIKESTSQKFLATRLTSLPSIVLSALFENTQLLIFFIMLLMSGTILYFVQLKVINFDNTFQVIKTFPFNLREVLDFLNECLTRVCWSIGEPDLKDGDRSPEKVSVYLDLHLSYCLHIFNTSQAAAAVS